MILLVAASQLLYLTICAQLVAEKKVKAFKPDNLRTIEKAYNAFNQFVLDLKQEKAKSEAKNIFSELEFKNNDLQVCLTSISNAQSLINTLLE